MSSLITLALLACAPIVVGYLAWRYRCPRGVTTHDRHPATHNQGERTMTSEMARPAAEQVIRWMEDSPKVFEGVRRLLDACDQATEAARVAQTDRERLLQQCEGLREQVRQLQAELARLQKERGEAAHWFATMMREAAARFPTTPPPA
jgi:polyhydroxyalkanoate synthesis regulator phasin